jgi:hypothetical protein
VPGGVPAGIVTETVPLDPLTAFPIIVGVAKLPDAFDITTLNAFPPLKVPVAV